MERYTVNITNEALANLENIYNSYITKHWTIENSLNWVLENTFKENKSTIKKEKYIVL